MERSEVEELLAQGRLIVLLGLLGLVAGLFFAETGGLPIIDLSLGVVDRGEGLFMAMAAIH